MSIDDLDKLAGMLTKLPELLGPASTAAAEALEAVIEAQFVGGFDPYGQTWAPLKDGSASHLEASGDLRGAVHVLPWEGISVEFDVPYAQYHQTGTSRMPQRRLVPEEGDWQSSLWGRAVEEAYTEFFGRAMTFK